MIEIIRYSRCLLRVCLFDRKQWPRCAFCIWKAAILRRQDLNSLPSSLCSQHTHVHVCRDFRWITITDPNEAEQRGQNAGNANKCNTTAELRCVWMCAVVCVCVWVSGRRVVNHRVQRPLLLRWGWSLILAARSLPAGRNLWRLQCNKAGKCWG